MKARTADEDDGSTRGHAQRFRLAPRRHAGANLFAEVRWLVPEFGEPGVRTARSGVLVGDGGPGDQRHGQIAGREQHRLAVQDEPPPPHAHRLVAGQVQDRVDAAGRGLLGHLDLIDFERTVLGVHRPDGTATAPLVARETLDAPAP
jgi:hypothetical protein